MKLLDKSTLLGLILGQSKLDPRPERLAALPLFMQNTSVAKPKLFEIVSDTQAVQRKKCLSMILSLTISPGKFHGACK